MAEIKRVLHMKDSGVAVLYLSGVDNQPFPFPGSEADGRYRLWKIIFRNQIYQLKEEDGELTLERQL
jgi:hypothetical protein